MTRGLYGREGAAVVVVTWQTSGSQRSRFPTADLTPTGNPVAPAPRGCGCVLEPSAGPANAQVASNSLLITPKCRPAWIGRTAARTGARATPCGGPGTEPSRRGGRSPSGCTGPTRMEVRAQAARYHSGHCGHRPARGAGQPNASCEAAGANPPPGCTDGFAAEAHYARRRHAVSRARERPRGLAVRHRLLRRAPLVAHDRGLGRPRGRGSFAVPRRRCRGPSAA